MQLTHVLHGADKIGTVTQHTDIRQLGNRALSSGINHRLRFNPVFSLDIDEVRLGCMSWQAFQGPRLGHSNVVGRRFGSLCVSILDKCAARHKATHVTMEKSYDATGNSQITDSCS